ncbi:MAG: SPOR domain-containing protein [Spirochaetales bacterium]|nr:SPOR domain-containing protein [Spirochaetales bacterium]
MADNQEKKSFYALNLTEGRMFGVFIGIVLVLVAVFFAIMVTAFKLSKPKSGPINIRTETIEKKDSTTQNAESAFSFYSDLAGEDAVKQDDVLTKEVIKVNQEVPTQTSETQNAPAISQNAAADNNTETVEEPQLSIDNSEILYSSRYQQNQKFKKDETKPAANQTAQTVKAAVQAKQSETKSAAADKPAEQKNSVANVKTAEPAKPVKVETASKDKSVRYVVQVGSYTNKKIADEIAQHYNKAGYPVYQQEFSKDGQTYYRLRIGPFKEKDRAENYLLSVKDSKYGKNSYISKIFI